MEGSSSTIDNTVFASDTATNSIPNVRHTGHIGHMDQNNVVDSSTGFYKHDNFLPNRSLRRSSVQFFPTRSHMSSSPPASMIATQQPQHLLASSVSFDQKACSIVPQLDVVDVEETELHPVISYPHNPGITSSYIPPTSPTKPVKDGVIEENLKPNVISSTTQRSAGKTFFVPCVGVNNVQISTRPRSGTGPKRQYYKEQKIAPIPSNIMIPSLSSSSLNELTTSTKNDVKPIFGNSGSSSISPSSSGQEIPTMTVTPLPGPLSDISGVAVALEGVFGEGQESAVLPQNNKVSSNSCLDQTNDSSRSCYSSNSSSSSSFSAEVVDVQQQYQYEHQANQVRHEFQSQSQLHLVQYLHIPHSKFTPQDLPQITCNIESATTSVIGTESGIGTETSCSFSSTTLRPTPRSLAKRSRAEYEVPPIRNLDLPRTSPNYHRTLYADSDHEHIKEHQIRTQSTGLAPLSSLRRDFRYQFPLNDEIMTPTSSISYLPYHSGNSSSSGISTQYDPHDPRIGMKHMREYDAYTEKDEELPFLALLDQGRFGMKQSPHKDIIQTLDKKDPRANSTELPQTSPLLLCETVSLKSGFAIAPTTHGEEVISNQDQGLLLEPFLENVEALSIQSAMDVQPVGAILADVTGTSVLKNTPGITPVPALFRSFTTLDERLTISQSHFKPTQVHDIRYLSGKEEEATGSYELPHPTLYNSQRLPNTPQQLTQAQAQAQAHSQAQAQTQTQTQTQSHSNIFSERHDAHNLTSHPDELKITLTGKHGEKSLKLNLFPGFNTQRLATTTMEIESPRYESIPRDITQESSLLPQYQKDTLFSTFTSSAPKTVTVWPPLSTHQGQIQGRLTNENSGFSDDDMKEITTESKETPNITIQNVLGVESLLPQEQSHTYLMSTLSLHNSQTNQAPTSCHPRSQALEPACRNPRRSSSESKKQSNQLYEECTEEKPSHENGTKTQTPYHHRMRLPRPDMPSKSLNLPHLTTPVGLPLLDVKKTDDISQNTSRCGFREGCVSYEVGSSRIDHHSDALLPCYQPRSEQLSISSNMPSNHATCFQHINNANRGDHYSLSRKNSHNRSRSFSQSRSVSLSRTNSAKRSESRSRSRSPALSSTLSRSFSRGTHSIIRSKSRPQSPCLQPLIRALSHSRSPTPLHSSSQGHSQGQLGTPFISTFGTPGVPTPPSFTTYSQQSNSSIDVGLSMGTIGDQHQRSRTQQGHSRGFSQDHSLHVPDTRTRDVKAISFMMRDTNTASPQLEKLSNGHSHGYSYDHYPVRNSRNTRNIQKVGKLDVPEIPTSAFWRQREEDSMLVIRGDDGDRKHLECLGHLGHLDNHIPKQANVQDLEEMKNTDSVECVECTEVFTSSLKDRIGMKKKTIDEQNREQDQNSNRVHQGEHTSHFAYNADVSSTISPALFSVLNVPSYISLTDPFKYIPFEFRLKPCEMENPRQYHTSCYRVKLLLSRKFTFNVRKEKLMDYVLELITGSRRRKQYSLASTHYSDPFSLFNSVKKTSINLPTSSSSSSSPSIPSSLDFDYRDDKDYKQIRVHDENSSSTFSNIRHISSIRSISPNLSRDQKDDHEIQSQTQTQLQIRTESAHCISPSFWFNGQSGYHPRAISPSLAAAVAHGQCYGGIKTASSPTGQKTDIFQTLPSSMNFTSHDNAQIRATLESQHNFRQAPIRSLLLSQNISRFSTKAQRMKNIEAMTCVTNAISVMSDCIEGPRFREKEKLALLPNRFTPLPFVDRNTKSLGQYSYTFGNGKSTQSGKDLAISATLRGRSMGFANFMTHVKNLPQSRKVASSSSGIVASQTLHHRNTNNSTNTVLGLTTPQNYLTPSFNVTPPHQQEHRGLRHLLQRQVNITPSFEIRPLSSTEQTSNGISHLQVGEENILTSARDVILLRGPSTNTSALSTNPITSWIEDNDGDLDTKIETDVQMRDVTQHEKKEYAHHASFFSSCENTEFGSPLAPTYAIGLASKTKSAANTIVDRENERERSLTCVPTKTKSDTFQRPSSTSLILSQLRQSASSHSWNHSITTMANLVSSSHANSSTCNDIFHQEDNRNPKNDDDDDDDEDACDKDLRKSRLKIASESLEYTKPGEQPPSLFSTKF